MKRQIIEHDDSIGIKFTYASNVENSKLDKLSNDESRFVMFSDGTRTFKKEVLGLFSTKTVKTYNELSSILYNTKICETQEEVDIVLTSLTKKDLPYYKKSLFSGGDGLNYIRLEQTLDEQEKKYIIRLLN